MIGEKGTSITYHLSLITFIFGGTKNMKKFLEGMLEVYSCSAPGIKLAEQFDVRGVLRVNGEKLGARVGSGSLELFRPDGQVPGGVAALIPTRRLSAQ